MSLRCRRLKVVVPSPNAYPLTCKPYEILYVVSDDDTDHWLLAYRELLVA